MPPRTTFSLDRDTVPERSTVQYVATLVDERNSAISAGDLSSLQLTLYDASDPRNLAILNSVLSVGILNTGRGSVTSAGSLIITLLPADNAIRTDGVPVEQHVMLIEWTYGGTKGGRHEVEFRVANFAKVS